MKAFYGSRYPSAEHQAVIKARQDAERSMIDTLRELMQDEHNRSVPVPPKVADVCKRVAENARLASVGVSYLGQRYADLYKEIRARAQNANKEHDWKIVHQMFRKGDA